MYSRALIAWNRFDRYLVTALLTAFFVWVVFQGEGGLQSGAITAIWLVALPLSALIVSASILMRGTARLFGGLTLGLLTLYTALVAVSIVWSLIPSATWLEFNRTVTYLAVFATGITLARLWSKSWLPIIAATTLTVSVVVIYALLAKVAPASVAPDEVFARLRVPFNYWNAVGLSAAFGAPLFLWLGTEERIHRLLRAAAYPLLGLCLVALLLSYSRGGLLIAIIGVVCWFILAPPKRLSSIPILGASIIAATPAVAWTFSKSALTEDNVDLVSREAAGWELGMVLVLLSVFLYGAALLLQWLESTGPLSARTWAGVGKYSLGILVVIPVVVVVALATSDKGLTGNIESGWNSLTSEEATTPANSPSRFGSTASVRSRYWREAGDIWVNHYYKGSGAGTFEITRKQYRRSPVVVAHAHGQVPQALADLGLAGVLLIVFAGLAWLVAAYRTLTPAAGARMKSWEPERSGFTVMTVLVIMFGIHSAIDWTWYVPGVALPMLLIAGCVAGRGPLTRALPAIGSLGRYKMIARTAAAVVVLAAAGLAMWSVAQPQRASDKVDRALELSDEKKFEQAAAEARSAHRTNPTSVEPFFALSTIEHTSGNLRGGLGPLEQAVRLQPANPLAWERLGEYFLFDLGRAQDALSVLQRAVFLNPHDVNISQLFIKAEAALEIKRQREAEAERRLKRLKKRRKARAQAEQELMQNSQTPR